MEEETELSLLATTDDVNRNYHSMIEESCRIDEGTNDFYIILNFKS